MDKDHDPRRSCKGGPWASDEHAADHTVVSSNILDSDDATNTNEYPPITITPLNHRAPQKGTTLVGIYRHNKRP